MVSFYPEKGKQRFVETIPGTVRPDRFQTTASKEGISFLDLPKFLLTDGQKELLLKRAAEALEEEGHPDLAAKVLDMKGKCQQKSSE